MAPVLLPLVKRPMSMIEASVSPTMAPPWATTRKRPALYAAIVLALSAPPLPTAMVPSLMVSGVVKVLTPVKVSVPAPDLTRRPAAFAVLRAATLTLAPVPPPPRRATVGTVPAV